MSNFFRVYQRLLVKYPFGMQAVQTGILMGISDQIAQNFIEKKRPGKNLNYVRTAQFASLGFFMVGPTIRVWYGIIDNYFGSKGAAAVLKKVASDQLLFAPIFILILIGTIGAMQGNDYEGIKVKLQNEYIDILITNYKIWPLVQLVNFYFVPLNYQVLLAQSVAVLWNTYLSWRTNKGALETFE